MHDSNLGEIISTGECCRSAHELPCRTVHLGVKWGPGRAVVRGGSELPGAFARGEKQEKEEEETLKSRNSIEHQHCVKSGHNDAARTEGKSLSGRILS